jgi:hypothetical protein
MLAPILAVLAMAALFSVLLWVAIDQQPQEEQRA